MLSKCFFYVRNETEEREFFATSSCVQLSPASKEAEWTIYRDNLPTIREHHVSLVTPEGLLLMGGNIVDLVKPDGSVQRRVFDLETAISRGCGIKDEGTLIVTGGMYNYRETTRVERYNSQVRSLIVNIHLYLFCRCSEYGIF